MGTAIKHSVPDRDKPSFEIFDIRALWRSGRQRVNWSANWSKWKWCKRTVSQSVDEK